MAKSKTCEPSRELRIRRVDGTLHKEFQNIAAHKGISVTDLLKPELQKFIDSFPEHMKEEKPCEPCQEVRITGISRKLKKQLQNLADNHSIDVGSFLKPRLQAIADGYPAHMKQVKD